MDLEKGSGEGLNFFMRNLLLIYCADFDPCLSARLKHVIFAQSKQEALQLSHHFWFYLLGT